MAEAVDRSEAAVRQLAHRAREHVQARQPRFDTDRATQRAVTERFLAACVGGDLPALLASMAPEVVLVSDGGGKATAARRPVVGRRQGRPLPARHRGTKPLPELRMEVTEVNGAVAVVAWTAGEPYMAVQLQLVDGLVEQVLIFVNPDKLAGLTNG